MSVQVIDNGVDNGSERAPRAGRGDEADAGVVLVERPGLISTGSARRFRIFASQRSAKFTACPRPCAGGSHVFDPPSCRRIALGRLSGQPGFDFILDESNRVFSKRDRLRKILVGIFGPRGPAVQRHPADAALPGRI